MSAELYQQLLEIVERSILPLTERGVEAGNKIFGAAIVRREGYELVVAGTNEEIDCPLWHGEISAIRNFYRLPPEARPPPAECLFLSTHEPCSMCLSAITWAGYPAIYYLFGYEQTRDRFHIPHDLRILAEVFGCEDGRYRSENPYWKSMELVAAIAACASPEREVLIDQVEALRRVYDRLSDRYQETKADSSIPLP